MDSVFLSSVSGTPPAAPAVPLVGFPRAGNAMTGEKATRPGPYWYHMMTQEVRNVLLAAGLTPDAGDLTQLLQAMRLLFAAPGTGFYVYGTSAPAGALKANGSPVPVSTYGRLAEVIYCGDANNPTADWGYRCNDPLNPTTTRSLTGAYIVLPDGRGDFIRGFDDGRGVDAGRLLWKWQKGSLLMGNEAYDAQVMGFASVAADRVGIGWDELSSTAGYSGAVSHASTGVSQQAVLYNVDHYGVARPRNNAALACIHY